MRLDELLRSIGREVEPALPVAGWAPTVGGVRDSLLEGRVFDLSSEVRLPVYSLSDDDMSRLIEDGRSAVAAGRMIDAGELPAGVIQSEAERAVALMTDGHLRMPFSDPWVLYFTRPGEVFVSVICPEASGGCFSIFSMVPFEMSDRSRKLGVDDVMWLQPDMIDGAPGWDMHFRVGVLGEAAIAEGGLTREEGLVRVSRATLNPVIVVTSIMTTDGVQIETITPSEKDAKARRRSGKPPIPTFRRVLSAPYVTAILAAGQRREGEAKGGTHASPVAHIRRGHVRRLPNGKTTWVRDCLVNVSEESPPMRSHYVLKEGVR